MSSYSVLWSISEALRDLLWEGFQSETNRDPAFLQYIDNEAQIEFLNPTDTKQRKQYRISMWLYQIVENEFVKNQFPIPGSNAQTLHFPPLALNLSYLITPFGPTCEANHMLIGKIMQIFYENALVLLQTDVNTYDELSIILYRHSLEELTRIWDALKEPYCLSVAYQVRVTRIDSARVTGANRILRARDRFRQVPADQDADDAARKLENR